MGTITISASGFVATPASAPANWPSGNVAYPGAVAPNGSRSMTVSDADMLRLLSWTANQPVSVIGSSTPTMGQILLAYVSILRGGTIQAIQTNETVPAVVGTAITMT